MRRAWTRADLQGARLWWVVTLQVDRAYRWAESPLAIISSEDGSLAIAGGLQGAAVRQTAPFLGAPEQRHATLDLSPSAGLNPAALLSGRYMLDQAPVEVALWREGDTWEERQVLLDGLVVSYEWGGPDEVLSLEVEEAAYQDRGLLPPAGAVVSAATWPDAAEAAVGLYYPEVLGCPGSATIPGSVALAVVATSSTVSRLLIASCPVSAASVTIFDGSTSESFAVTTMADGLGRLVATVDISGAATIATDPALTYQVGWTEAGALSITSSTPATGAGSILEVVLSQSTLRIDRASLASVRDTLDAYKIGAFIQQQLSPLDWVTQVLLPLLPVAILTGPEGWRVVPIPLLPTRADCVATLEAGDGKTQVIRLGRARRDGFEDVANDLELRYAIDLQTNASSASARLSGGTPLDGAHSSLPARLSWSAYGRRVKSLETVGVYDEGTAYRILLWKAIAFQCSRSILRYSCVQEYAFLAPGSLVWLSDSLLQLERAAWVQSVDLATDGRVELELVIWGAECQ